MIYATMLATMAGCRRATTRRFGVSIVGIREYQSATLATTATTTRSLVVEWTTTVGHQEARD